MRARQARQLVSKIQAQREAYMYVLFRYSRSNCLRDIHAIGIVTRHRPYLTSSHTTHNAPVFHFPYHRAARAASSPPSPPPTALPVLLCGDLNARPQKPRHAGSDKQEEKEEEKEYPPEAVPIVLAGGEGEDVGGSGRSLAFSSCYDLNECVFRPRRVWL
jgi:hypothetical protein